MSAASRRVDLRGEAGAVGAGTVIWAAIIALIAWVFVAALDSERDHYGSVPVPGSGVVELPEGETAVYYREGVAPGAEATLVVPEDLDYSILDINEETAVRIDSRGGDGEEGPEGISRPIGAAFTEGEGLYEVTATSATAASQGVEPEIIFGQSPLRAIEDRALSVWDEARGPTGVVVLLALVIVAVLPGLLSSWRRSRRG